MRHAPEYSGFSQPKNVRPCVQTIGVETVVRFKARVWLETAKPIKKKQRGAINLLNTKFGFSLTPPPPLSTPRKTKVRVGGFGGEAFLR